MALRKLRGIRVSPVCVVNIYRNTEHDEYVVKSFVRGRLQGGEGGGYFASDKQDARDTAADIVRRLRRVPACRA